jgi:hypothetical protein
MTTDNAVAGERVTHAALRLQARSRHHRAALRWLITTLGGLLTLLLLLGPYSLGALVTLL